MSDMGGCNPGRGPVRRDEDSNDLDPSWKRDEKEDAREHPWESYGTES
jgi:hypothetical protein